MFAALRRKLPTIPVDARVDILLGVLLVIGWAGGFAAGVFWHPIKVQTRTVHTKVSLDAAIAALGAPDQAVDGSQIGLNGDTCFFWQSENILICKP